MTQLIQVLCLINDSIFLHKPFLKGLSVTHFLLRILNILVLDVQEDAKCPGLTERFRIVYPLFSLANILQM